MLDIVLALNCVLDCVESLKVDELFQIVPFCEAFDEPRSVFEHAANEIVGHTDIKDAVGTIGHEVNVAACHPEIV